MKKSRERSMLRKIRNSILVLFLLLLPLSGCSQQEANKSPEPSKSDTVKLSNIPEYSGTPYIALNDNEPEFTKEDLTTESFELYSELDDLGRCGQAYANISHELMPTEKRGSIGQVKPSGWHTVKYDIVDGKYLYNRSHLIGFQLAGENANEKNLITGTRYFNVEGMLPFENLVADYVKETGNHVLYRVTPIFNGQDLVASGVQMEARSVEDEGDGINYNVYVYNVQPGVTIDYATGESQLTDTEKSDSSDQEVEIRGNKNSKIYHMPGQKAYDDMEDSKNLIIFHSEQEAIDAGYRKAKQ